MVKTPDGIVTRDIEYTKATSDSLDTAKNIRQRVLHWAPRVLLGFIVACVVFYCYQVQFLTILIHTIAVRFYYIIFSFLCYIFSAQLEKELINNSFNGVV